MIADLFFGFLFIYLFIFFIFYAGVDLVAQWCRSTTICFVGFNSVPNLIVILFNLLYPVFIVGFNCKGCVKERESVNT